MQNFCIKFGSKLGVMTGFPKGTTLGGGSPGSVYNAGLQIGVAKKFAKILHLSWDPSQG